MEEQKPKTNEELMQEMSDYIKTLEFLSDQVRFNQVVYQGMSDIIKKLDSIEEKLKEYGKI
jgi:hypothetical protein